MWSAVLQLVGWTYLPDFATRQVLSAIHPLLQRMFQLPIPPPRSPVYARHYRYTYAAVVMIYLTYNFVEASKGVAKNFYELLGVSPVTDEGTLKTAFRAFARKHHPDRAGPEGEAFFVEVRDAFEALRDPVVRFAYDRFGPDVLLWRDCTTMKDYLRRGLLNCLPRHVMTGMGLFLISVVGKRSPVAAWRYLLFVGTFALELYLIVAPSSIGSSDGAGSEWTPGVFPHRVRYQHISLLHEVFVLLSIAVSRVAPVLFAGLMETDEEMEGRAVRAMGGRIGEVGRGIEREVWTMLSGEKETVGGDEMGVVMREMEDMVVENKLKHETGPMGRAWHGAVRGRGVRARCSSI